MTIDKNATYVHKGNVREYVIVNSCVVKIGGQWVKGVAYRNKAAGPESELYVRSVADFVNRFVKVDPIKETPE